MNPLYYSYGSDNQAWKFRLENGKGFRSFDELKAYYAQKTGDRGENWSNALLILDGPQPEPLRGPDGSATDPAWRLRWLQYVLFGTYRYHVLTALVVIVAVVPKFRHKVLNLFKR